MAAFQFSLERVLSLRQREAEAAGVRFAAVDAQRLEIEARLRRYQEQIIVGQGALREDLVGSVDAAGLRLRAHAALAGRQQAQTAAIQLAALANQLAEARTAMIEARRRVTMLENLRERRLETWNRTIDRRETAEADDRASHDVFQKESVA